MKESWILYIKAIRCIAVLCFVSIANRTTSLTLPSFQLAIASRGGTAARGRAGGAGGRGRHGNGSGRHGGRAEVSHFT